MVTTKLNLSMTEPQVRQIYAKQGDTGRVLDISLDQTPEDGTLRILRPDGVEVTSEAVTGGEVESGGTFESLTEADVTELTVGIEPVQDLHGYDSPWPAGGGKNLLPLIASEIKQNNGGESSWTGNSRTISDVTFTIQTNDSGDVIGISVNGTASATVSFYIVNSSYSIPSDKTYILNGCPAGGSSSSSYSLQGYDGAPYDSGTGSSEFSTITGGGIRIRISSGTVCNNLLFKPMIRLSTESDATFAPYSNICPITGHDEVRVTRTGINVWDEEWEVGSISGTGSNQNANDRIRSKNYISVVPNATYFYHINSTYGIFTWGYDANKNYVGRVPSNGYAISNNTVTIPTNVCYIRFVVQPGYGTTYNNDISINYPSTDHDYHAYQGSTYTTSLGQTVYGGTLDMVSGVLTVDREIRTFDGSEAWQVNTQFTNRFALGTNSKSSDYTKDVANYLVRGKWAITDGTFDYRDNGALYVMLDSSAPQMTLEEFKSFLSHNPLQIVYGVATPQTYQLTPQQIKTLVGTNNVWASSGDIVSIKFTYGGLFSELPSDATSVVGKCYCDVEQNGVSSMPFTLNVKKNERAT